MKEEEIKLVRERGKKKDSIAEGADQVGNPSFTLQLLEQRNALIRPKGVEISPKVMHSVGIGASPIKKKELPELKLKNQGRLRSLRQRPGWNDRFFVDGVTNFTPAHPYFKVLS